MNTNKKLSTVNYQLSIFLVAVFFVLPLKAQVNIGIDSVPHSFSILELTTSIIKGGLRLPQLTSDAISKLNTAGVDAAQGLVVYNTDTNCLEFWNGDAWVSLCGGTTTGCATQITGSANIGAGNAKIGGLIYSVPSKEGVTYTWSISGDGWSITDGGKDTNQITVTSGTVNAVISATPSDGTCVSTLNVTYNPNGCGAMGNNGKWLRFMCYNLGVTNTDFQSLSPEEQAEYENENNDTNYYDYDKDTEGWLGWLYQWGRPTDGHQLRNSETTDILSTNSTATAPDDVVGKFILSSDSPLDWLSGSGHDNRWGDGTQNENQAKAANDPCPQGWKVPSIAQWQSVIDNNAWNQTDSRRGALFYPAGNTHATLYLPLSRYRNPNDGTIVLQNGIYIFTPYWSSTGSVDGDGDYASSMVIRTFTAVNFFINSETYIRRGVGESVRCIADE